MSGVYINAFCVACHKLLMVPQEDPEAALAGVGWFQIGGSKDWVCSDDCLNSGAALVVREKVGVAHVRFAPREKAAYKTGTWAALDGFDCVSKDPDYVRGHAFGMSLREVVKAAVQEMKKEKA